MKTRLLAKTVVHEFAEQFDVLTELLGTVARDLRETFEYDMVDLRRRNIVEIVEQDNPLTLDRNLAITIKLSDAEWAEFVLHGYPKIYRVDEEIIEIPLTPEAWRDSKKTHQIKITLTELY